MLEKSNNPMTLKHNKSEGESCRIADILWLSSFTHIRSLHSFFKSELILKLCIYSLNEKYANCRNTNTFQKRIQPEATPTNLSCVKQLKQHHISWQRALLGHNEQDELFAVTSKYLVKIGGACLTRGNTTLHIKNAVSGVRKWLQVNSS